MSSSPSAAGSSPYGFSAPSVEHLNEVISSYEFLEILGQGGMGAVYKARQSMLDRLVAIKVLPPFDYGDEMRMGERFQREARAMGRLSHPNIVSVFDFGQAEDGLLYIVMEYVEGTDLHQLIRTGELNEEHVLGWVPQICDALEYAHQSGIVHRDIKPANIMITTEGVVKVADFGLAKLTESDAEMPQLTMTNMAMGTPDYVAPEVLDSDVQPDHRADLYALGVMIYEMLVGKVPRGTWKLPSQHRPGTDPRFDTLIEKALETDREEHYQSAAEIGTNLYEIAAGAPQLDPIGRDSSASLVAKTAPNRKKAVSAATVALAAVVAVVAGGVVWFLAGPGAEPEETTSLAALATPPGQAIATPEPPGGAPAIPPRADEPKAPLPSIEEANEPVAPPAEPAASPVAPESEPEPKESMTELAAEAADQPEDAIPTAPAVAESGKKAESPAAASPQPETPSGDPRLADLEKGFQAAVERNAGIPYAQSMAQLDESYLGALSRARTAAQRAGNLDEVTALDRERQSRQSGEAIPVTDEEGIPASLAALRETYRQAQSQHQLERDTKTAPLYEKYLAALDLYETELTRGDRIDDALLVREFRKTIEQRLAAVTSEAAAPAVAAAAEPPAAAPETPPSIRTRPRTGEKPDPEYASSAELLQAIADAGGEAWFVTRSNPALTEFTGDNAPSGRFSLVDVQFRARDQSLSPEAWTALAEERDLTRLEIHFLELPEDFSFANMVGLEDLVVARSPGLEETRFGTLGQLPFLKSLNLLYVNFPTPVLPPEEMTALAASPSLQRILLEAVAVDNPSLAAVAAIPTLETFTLTLPRGECDSSFLAGFTNHPSLREINLSGWEKKPFDNADLAPLFTIPTLELYSVIGMPQGKEALAAFAKMSDLRRLDIMIDPSVGDAELASLAPLANLEQLLLYRLEATGTGFAGFECGDSLRMLVVDQGSGITDEGLAVIAERFPHLEELVIAADQLTSTGLSAIAGLKELKRVNITSRSLGDDFLSALAGHDEIVHLELIQPEATPPFTPETLAALKACASLRRIDITSTSFLPGTVESLGAIRGLTSLSLFGELDSSDYPSLAGLEGINYLCLQAVADELLPNLHDAVTSRKKFGTIRIHRCSFSDKEAARKLLAEAADNVIFD